MICFLRAGMVSHSTMHATTPSPISRHYMPSRHLPSTCQEQVIPLTKASFFRAETIERNCGCVLSPRERAKAAMASVKVLLVERVFSSRKVSALVTAVLTFWKQEQKIPKFLCQASAYQLMGTAPRWHHSGAGKMKGGKTNDLMEMDGVSLKQILPGEGAECNLESENEIVHIQLF